MFCAHEGVGYVLDTLTGSQVSKGNLISERVLASASTSPGTHCTLHRCMSRAHIRQEYQNRRAVWEEHGGGRKAGIHGPRRPKAPPAPAALPQAAQQRGLPAHAKHR